MLISVPRHLNKKSLIAGLEPIELLGIATLLIGSNVMAKFFEMSGLLPALGAGSAFLVLKILKRGKARGHFLFVLQQQLRPRLKHGYLRGEKC